MENKQGKGRGRGRGKGIVNVKPEIDQNCTGFLLSERKALEQKNRQQSAIQAQAQIYDEKAVCHVTTNVMQGNLRKHKGPGGDSKEQDEQKNEKCTNKQNLNQHHQQEPLAQQQNIPDQKSQQQQQHWGTRAAQRGHQHQQQQKADLNQQTQQQQKQGAWGSVQAKQQHQLQTHPVKQQYQQKQDPAISQQYLHQQQSNTWGIAPNRQQHEWEQQSDSTPYEKQQNRNKSYQQFQFQQRQDIWDSSSDKPSHQQKHLSGDPQQPQWNKQKCSKQQKQEQHQYNPWANKELKGSRIIQSQQRNDGPQNGNKGKNQKSSPFSSSHSSTMSPTSPESLQSVGNGLSKTSINSEKSKQEQKKEIESFITSEIPVLRGTKGYPTSVEVNYIDLNINNMIDVAWQYDVQFVPETPKKFLRNAFKIFSENVLYPKGFLMAFDGQKIAYCHSRIDSNLLNKPYTANVIESVTGKSKTFKVTIKETAFPVIELNSLRNYKNDRIFDKPMRAVQCLDVIMRQVQFDGPKAVRVGRSFYMEPSQCTDIKDGYELWLGLFQAAVLGERPLLNIDISHKAFPSVIPLIRHIEIQNPKQELHFRSKDKLHYFLRNLEIIYTPPGIQAPKRFKCNGLSDIPSKCQFKKADNCLDNVLNYFENEKGIKLEYPNLPCLSVGTKQIKLPMEFCSIAWGQAVNKKPEDNQVREIIKMSATSTNKRKEKILDIFGKFDYEHNALINKFKIYVGKNFLNINARILDAPKLQYASSQIKPIKGSWRLCDNDKFIVAKKLLEWSILITDSKLTEFDAKNLVQMMIKVGRTLNMNINENCNVYKAREDDPGQIEQELRKFKSSGKDLVVVIISGFKDSYAKVKRLAENHCGILTQCIKSGTLRRLDLSVVQNILLKINVKLTGVNHKIANEIQSTFSFNEVMFIGADVTHPSQEQRQIPSVVGVAATHDQNRFQYNMRYRLQDPTKEIIQDMEDILHEQLLYYRSKVKSLPKKKIYYRDGISDGQFQQVRRIEINSMYRACSKAANGYKPDITCVIVQKRHHTRLFPPPKSDLGKLDRKYNNVPPGTIVDGIITHPAENQFFLVSHESIQGVAKPTKYCLIWDDSKFNIDDLQAMTYSLCHMFTRCNRAVSYPAPAYYAHLAAARGRVYIEGSRFQSYDWKKEYEKRKINEELLLTKPMFFV